MLRYTHSARWTAHTFTVMFTVFITCLVQQNCATPVSAATRMADCCINTVSNEMLFDKVVHKELWPPCSHICTPSFFTPPPTIASTWSCHEGTLHSNTRRGSRKSEDGTCRVFKSWMWNYVVKKQIAEKVWPAVWERCYTKWGWTLERSERDRDIVVKRLLYSGNL